MGEGRLEKNIKSFDRDTKKFGGYIYTSSGKLSSIISNRHISETIIGLASLKGKRVLDVGCGDGTYTLELLRFGKPLSIRGFDPSKEAIKSAKFRTKKIDDINFSVNSIYTYRPRKKFDIAVVRGVLHHLYQPERAIAQISKCAKEIVIAEPNGYNPVLKIIEKFSLYHREHEEKSYPPVLLDNWIRKHGGVIRKRKYAGLIPFFCPDSIARFLQLIRPLVECLPILNMLVCGSYYVVYDSPEC